MREPCMCGAEDCKECFPQLAAKDNDHDDGIEPETPAPYQASDPKNRWMDFICDGYRDVPY